MKTLEFIHLVSRMRTAQKEAAHSHDGLVRRMKEKYEKQVDDILARMPQEEKNTNQLNIF